MSWIHDRHAQLIDGISFGFINLLQLRARAGLSQLAELENYIERWENVPLNEYYKVPETAGIADLPDHGRKILPSPHPLGINKNDHVFLDYWPGPNGWRSPVMFLLHGVMSVSDVGYRLWAKKLNKLGWGAIFFHLPFHYGRTPKGSISGEMALTANAVLTAEGLRQAVIELRWIAAALKSRGVPEIGLWGTSYGGWIASLLAILEQGISTAWLLEPIVNVEQAIWESPACRTLRRQLRHTRIQRELVHRHLPLVCPSYHTPTVDPQRIILMAGRFDRIATPATIKDLSQHWAGSHYREFNQGHVGYQLMPESLRLATKLFGDLFTMHEHQKKSENADALTT